VDPAAVDLPPPPPPPEDVHQIADIFELYEDQLKSPGNGLVYAIAYSHDSVKKVFVPRLLEFVLSGTVPPSLCLLFLGECSQFFGDYQECCFAIVYESLAADCSEFVAAAIREMALNSRSVFLEHFDLLVSPLLTAIVHCSPSVFCLLTSALLNFDSGTVRQAIQLGLQNLVSGLVFGDDLEELFGFLHHFLFLDEVGEKREYFCDLFGRIMQIADRLWAEPAESVQEGLCSFVDDGFKQNLIEEPNRIWDWIMISLMNFPCSGHMWLLNEYPSHFLTGNWQIDRRFIDSLLDVARMEDGELQLQMMRFVKFLADSKWPPFFDHFSVEFFLSLFTSENDKLVELAVSVIVRIILQPDVIDHIEMIVKTLLVRMFTNFDDFAIAQCIKLFVLIIQKKLCTPDNIKEAIAVNLKFGSREPNDFVEALSELRRKEEEEEEKPETEDEEKACDSGKGQTKTKKHTKVVDVRSLQHLAKRMVTRYRKPIDD
jgi:hypothetical protein